MLKLAVIGNPIFHSKSPIIHSQMAKETSIQLHYNRISCEKPEDAIYFAQDLKIDGLNVTSPFKRSILNHIQKLDYQASNLSSSNTLKFNNDGIEGYNTDYFGVLRTIWDNNLIFNKKKVLIFGAGLAAQTAAFAVRNLNSILYIWDRNEEKAKQVSENMGIRYIKSAEISQSINTFDFIFSTIPPHSEILQELSFNNNQIIFDSVYHNSFFALNQKKFGYQLIKGEKWLINQALLAFDIFTGQKVEYPTIENYLQNYSDSKPNILILVGFSGSGKTTLGKKVAKKLNFNFIDLDSEIESEIGLKIPYIFEKYGEEKFREKETELLKKIQVQLSESKDYYLLSVGGGILENPENIKILKQIGRIIWLYSPFEKCYSRISNLKDRPLLKNETAAKMLYDKRKESYFYNSEYIFLNFADIEEAAYRLASEISRII